MVMKSTRVNSAGDSSVPYTSVGVAGVARALLLGLALAASGCTGPAASPGSEEDNGAEDGDAGADDKAVGTSRYEAENRTGQSGCTVESNRTGFTGSGFMDFGASATWIEWNNVSAAAAGQYTLTLRFANGGASARPAAITVNNGNAGTVQFSPTGEWTSWTTASLVVSLRQGNNTIRVTASTSTGGPNVDHAELTAKDLCPSDPNKTAPGACGCGKAEGTCGGTTDLCPSDPNKTAPGACGCGKAEGTCGGTVSKIKLPIEVLGPAGTKEIVEFRLDSLSNITHLYLRCNSCGYHDDALDSNAAKVKATVRVNGGSAIALKHYTAGSGVVGNSSIVVIGAEADYGGIGGVFRTARFKVPVTGLVVGLNKLTFEHVTPAAPSMGFRIIDLNLLRSNSTSNRVFAEADLLRDDPATWTGPSTSASEISAGKALWSKRKSLYDPGLDAFDGIPNRGGAVNGNIDASCADCHASDGRDLAYFNFSNRSIIERSYFHGLSKAAGGQIASYIRSLKSTVPVVSAARPWNPAYQPGPGLDAKPAYQWAAGAGVDAILDRDADMAGSLFPGGESLTSVRQVVNRFGKLNLRELRVSLPMPEWNQWLPHIHPDDAFNTGLPAIRQDDNGSGLSQPFYTELYKAAAADATPKNIGNMTTRVKAWLKRGMTCATNGSGSGEPWRGLNGGVLNAIKLPKKTYTTCLPKESRNRQDEEAYEVTKRGLAAWISVKQWEIVHSKSLEDEGKKKQTASIPYPGGNRTLNSDSVCSSQCVDGRERGWVVTGRNVFDRPPHFTGHNSRHFYGQDIVTGVAETNSWYHLNMILDPGYRVAMPNHFAYVCSHIEILQAESNVDQGFRFWASMIKQRQLQTNGLYGAETGNDLRTSQPHVYYKANRNGNSDTQSSVGSTLWKYLAQAMVEDFVADSNRATRAEWEGAVNNSEVQDWDNRDFSTGTTFDTGKFQGRNTYRVIPRLREIGVASSVVDSLVAWGRKTWTNFP